ncbi:MAG: hypothetical protein ACRDT9_07105, partial [Agromyces sp.]
MEVLDLLLGCQSADVADEHLAVRRHLATPGLVASAGGEAFGVDAATPEPEAIDAEGLELVDRRRRRRECQRGATVQA